MREKRNNIKIYAPFIECTSEIYNTQIDDADDLDVVIPMYNFTEYNNNYLKTSERLWHYYRDEPAAAIENSESFKAKIKIAVNPFLW